MFGMLFKKTEPQEVYCQICGDELTSKGGDVGGNGSIYCNGYKNDLNCVEKAAVKEKRAMVTDYCNAKEIQKDILKKRLRSFGKLEKEAQ